MIFDQKMTSLIRSGRFDAAKNLLIRKYPHLKEDSDRIAMYIRRYKNRENLKSDTDRTAKKSKSLFF